MSRRSWYRHFLRPIKPGKDGRHTYGVGWTWREYENEKSKVLLGDCAGRYGHPIRVQRVNSPENATPFDGERPDDNESYRCWPQPELTEAQGGPLR